MYSTVRAWAPKTFLGATHGRVNATLAGTPCLIRPFWLPHERGRESATQSLFGPPPFPPGYIVLTVRRPPFAERGVTTREKSALGSDAP